MFVKLRFPSFVFAAALSDWHLSSGLVLSRNCYYPFLIISSLELNFLSQVAILPWRHFSRVKINIFCYMHWRQSRPRRITHWNVLLYLKLPNFCFKWLWIIAGWCALFLICLASGMLFQRRDALFPWVAFKNRGKEHLSSNYVRIYLHDCKTCIEKQYFW